MVSWSSMRSGAIRATLAVVFFAIGAISLAPAASARMEDGDRQRLRQELRQQERSRMRAQRQPPQGEAESAGSWGQGGSPRQRALEPRRAKPEQWQGPAGAGRPSRAEGFSQHPRLSPEEREQLREQLRQRQDGWRR